MPDTRYKPDLRSPPPAPLIPQSVGGWLRPLGKAVLTALAASGRQLVRAARLDTLVAASSARQ